MNRTKFLKEAKEKYRKQLEDKNKFVDEMNFVYDNNLVLRVWFDNDIQSEILKSKNTGKNLEQVPESAYCHRWCTVETLPIQTQNSQERSLIRKAGQILSADNDEEMIEMINCLRTALKTEPDQTADYIDGVTMWQNVEYSFTVKGACEYIGIE